jgi:tripartite-type tricarboxylate transporter receptor subunit TctC
VIQKLYDAALKAIAKQQIQERFAREGLEVETSASPRDFAAFIAREIPFWSKVVRESGATAD